MTGDHMAHHLAVIGAGTMGVSIAALAVGHGLPVVLVDVDEDKLARVDAAVAHQLRTAQLMGALPANTTRGDLTTSASAEPAAGATAVVEAVTEQPQDKAKVLAEVSALVRPGTVLMTNTSSIPIDELASSAARPEELVGTHFMNPPYLIRTVEVVRGRRTSAAAADAATSVLAALGRTAVVVGDSPGFVTSRILHRMINDAARVVAEGVATPEAVDALLEGCLGHPTGPLRTADLIGLDNLVDSLHVLHERTGDEGCRPCDLLVEKVRAGEFGRKTGRGFYEYTEALS
jgi:methoxymalonate biosynthesis protein